MASAAESGQARRRRARRMGNVLATTYPDAHCELNYGTPLELTVATILSAQCTDRRVNEVTPALFNRYRSAAAYAAADRTELEGLIRSTGFFRNKTDSLIKLGRALLEHHDGQIPETLDELVKLPGIGRKTANVILGNAFGHPAIAVDTHVMRLSRRWEWTGESDPNKIELDLHGLFERAEWTMLNHRIIFHGRRVCHARKPACGACPLAADCPSFGVGPVDHTEASRLVVTP